MPTSRIHHGPDGTTIVEERAVAAIISRAIQSVPGTVRHASGLDRLTRRPLPRVELFMDSDGSAIAVEAMIAVVWPAPVADVAATVRATITQWVTDFTQIPVVSVNVSVGAIVPASALANSADATRATVPNPTATQLRPVTARPLAIAEIPEPRPLAPFLPVQVFPTIPRKEQ